ncbi:uncharacterized protein C8Q71DRAFT_753844 [Rhodofomes roseus]|uniref:Uncharacterized protein n=1 Tax=Rhodofomes roseus TaxID=34475 RepID=A0ABQ8KI52_9APHY|nr:uncharacterized protein C8Q71DRAFT_753844 [Rhodofomes roseus]KAH9837680.1 hypothetical protein C8Q71DRAFT_753844 [Rhodofomes roseus]
MAKWLPPTLLLHPRTQAKVTPSALHDTTMRAHQISTTHQSLRALLGSDGKCQFVRQLYDSGSKARSPGPCAALQPACLGRRHHGLAGARRRRWE